MPAELFVPLFDEPTDRGGRAALHGEVGLWRRQFAEDPLRRDALPPLEPLMLEEVHDGTDLGEIKRAVVDEKVQYALPEVLVLQCLSQPSADDRTGQGFATAKAAHLRQRRAAVEV